MLRRPSRRRRGGRRPFAGSWWVGWGEGMVGGERGDHAVAGRAWAASCRARRFAALCVENAGEPPWFPCWPSSSLSSPGRPSRSARTHPKRTRRSLQRRCVHAASPAIARNRSSAVLRQIRLVHGGRLDHRRELVARVPALGPRIGVGKQLALATSLLPPAVQGRLGNPLLPRQLPQGHIVRRRHLLQDRCPAFFWVCHVIGLFPPT